jgi:hypothetical protein
MECSKSGRETGRRSRRLAVDLTGRLVGRTTWDISVVDLSLGGCLLGCPAMLDNGAIVDVRLDVSGHDMLLKGRVISVSLDGTSLSDCQRFLVALEFLSVPACEGALLRRYLDEKLRRRAEPA